MPINHVMYERVLYCCNVALIRGIKKYSSPKDYVYDLFAELKPKDPFADYASATYRIRYFDPSSAVLMFAQGAEDHDSPHRYAYNLRDYVVNEKLGTVIDIPPTPNMYHSDKPTALFMWIINRQACKNWWDAEHKARNGAQS